MKKFFAFALLLVLATSASFATDVMTDDAEGYFTAKVYCPIEVSLDMDGGDTVFLGWIAAGTSDADVTGLVGHEGNEIMFSFSGGTGGTTTVTCTLDGTGTYGTAANDGKCYITGAEWSISEATLEGTTAESGNVFTETYVINDTEDTGSCNPQDDAYSIKITVNTLTADADATINEFYTYPATVSATLAY